MADEEPTPGQVDRGLARFVARRFDPARLPALIAAALAEQHDDHAAAMLRRGASLVLRPLDDGRVALVACFSDDAELLAATRAAAWGEQPERPPPPGSEARGEQHVLAVVPAAALAALPCG